MLKSTILVAVADIKGGVGKTTTAMLIAGCLARRGEHVTVLDADNTGGATLWTIVVAKKTKPTGLRTNPTSWVST